MAVTWFAMYGCCTVAVHQGTHGVSSGAPRGLSPSVG